MAKRVIQECDLTKQEYDPDETVVITIKKKGKRQGRSYDLSPDAASKLEQQLVAGNEATLPEGWGFASAQPTQKNKRRTLEDLENEDEDEEDDSGFVANKKAELRDQGVIGDDDEEREPNTALGQALGASGQKCRHINKSRIQTAMRKGKRYAYRTCNDCHKTIEEMTAENRRQYMTGKPPKGVKIKDI
jgi:hypothetical protein